MPYVSATLYAPPCAELTARIIAALTDLTVEVLRKERARTTVVVQYVPGGQWARGGAALPVRGYFVAVEELAADSWGYTGETQELHYLGNKLPNGAAP
jgi:phenylpyruvate tautomerase PptA (4-oxalocrotonate tautomerase family)